ncbi:20777_t:CDS:1, partial [Racocetra persica]
HDADCRSNCCIDGTCGCGCRERCDDETIICVPPDLTCTEDGFVVIMAQPAVKFGHSEFL